MQKGSDKLCVANECYDQNVLGVAVLWAILYLSPYSFCLPVPRNISTLWLSSSNLLPPMFCVASFITVSHLDLGLLGHFPFSFTFRNFYGTLYFLLEMRPNCLALLFINFPSKYLSLIILFFSLLWFSLCTSYESHLGSSWYPNLHLGLCSHFCYGCKPKLDAVFK
jgi:hypothetical protein